MLSIFLTAAPAMAFPDFGLDGRLSAGLGAGFGDEDVGPFVLSGKYWSETVEGGLELFYDGDTGDDIDQFGLAWLAVRYTLHPEEGNSTYMGMGGGLMVNKSSFENSFGYVALLGWDSEQWGFEFKYGYYDPSIYSVVTYWHF
jgi:hypothetical protein